MTVRYNYQTRKQEEEKGHSTWLITKEPVNGIMLASLYLNCCYLQCNDVFKGLKYVLRKTPKFSLEMFGAFFLADVSCKNNYCLLIKNINTSLINIYDNGENRIVLWWAVFYEIFSGYSIFPVKSVAYFGANSKPILCFSCLFDVIRCGVYTVHCTVFACSGLC